jgi:prolyl-tRNA synthetase
MVLAESGEDTVLRCDACGYAANAERAELPENGPVDATGESAAWSRVDTPGAHTVAEVCDFLKVGADRLIKTIIVVSDGTPVAALVRGDRELQLQKLSRFLGAPTELADADTVVRVTNAPVGFAGPVGLKEVRIVADLELRDAVEMVTGANENDAHLTGVAVDRDFEVSEWGDIRLAIEGDRCAQPGCAGRYHEAHGIEVGHIFKLGTKYSRDMKAQVQTDTGENIDIIMGC